MTEAEREARRRQYIDQFVEGVCEHGWMVQGVFPTTDEPDAAPFAYTVGLALKQLPELIVFGLGHQTAGLILNDLAQRQIERGPYQPGDELADVTPDYRTRLLAVRDSSEHLTMANLIAGRRSGQAPIPALQVVFPDREHRWPWEPGSQVAHIPLLGPTPELPAG